MTANGSCNSKLYTFIVLWTAYGSTYFLRKPFGVIKKALSADLSLPESHLGWLDASFLLPYAAVQICIGNIGDKYDPGKTVALALFTAAAAMMVFSQVSFPLSLAGLLFLNGAAQSLCWPTISKVLSALYDGQARNTMFGILSTSCFVGAISSTFMAVYIQNEYGYEAVFPICSAFVVCVGVLVLLTIRGYSTTDSPENKSDPDKDFYDKLSVITEWKDLREVSVAAVETCVPDSKETSNSYFSFLHLFKIKLVPELSVVMACLKLVRYSMYMWLPMYLTVQAGYRSDKAGMISTVFDVGGVLGSVAIGPIINRVFSGKSVYGVTLFVSLSTAAFVGFILSSHQPLISATFLLLAGAFNSGPDGMIAGVLSTDIGDRDGRNKGSAVTGLINGFGGLGAVIEGPLIGWISQVYSWSAVFPCMVIVSLIASAICCRITCNVHRQTNTNVLSL